MKYTKGPWKWEGDGLFSTTEEQKDGEHIVLVLGRPFSVYDEDRAIIAAAPTMYELLEHIARSACLQQRIGDKCICFSCEAKRILEGINGNA